MGRASNQAARRDQIVMGLLVVMARAGYEGATIQAIGRAAGLTPGLVHYHFRSKQEVLVALVEKLGAQLEARYRSRAEAAKDAHGRLAAFIDAHVALGRDADPRAVAAWTVVGTEALRQPEVRVLVKKALARDLGEMKALVHACLVADGRSTRGEGRIAAALVSAIEGAYRIAALAPPGVPRGYAAPMVRHMAQSLIMSQPRKP